MLYSDITIERDFFIRKCSNNGLAGLCIRLVTNIVMIARFNTCPSLPKTFHTIKSELFIFFLGCYNG